MPWTEAKGKELVECKTCKAQVERRCYRNHVLNHGEPRFPCDICKTHKAHTKTKLRRHQYTIHNIGPKSKYDCIFCKKRAADGNELEIHLRSHLRERPYLCKICPAEFSSLQGFKFNESAHKVPKRTPQFGCDFCPKIFREIHCLKTHLRTHAERKHYKCDICPKEFITSGGLRTHLKSHSQKEPYLCGFCDKTFKYKSSLERHILDHTGERFFPCKFCDKKFKGLTDLTNHVKWTHSGRKDLLKCQTCDKEFREKRALNRHVLQVHTKERPFLCTTCGKGFASKEYLRLHLKTHFGERRYSCKECAKKFLTATCLTIHMRTHTGEKPYSCPICSKSFAQKGNLKEHLKVHQQ